MSGRDAHRLGHVQGLRALAVVLVVAYHCDLPGVGGGFVGVDVFFVISGFVITGLLLRSRAAAGRMPFADFYLRRVRRLLPALAVVLVTVAVLSLFIESPLTTQRTTGRVGGFASVFLANAALYLTGSGYFAQPAGVIPVLHTWSLAVEEQFYLVFPAVLAVVLAAARRRPRRALVVTITSVSALSLALYLVGAYASSVPGLSDPGSAAFYAPVTRIWEFGAGALLALAFPLRTGRGVATGGAVLGLALIVAGAVLLDDGSAATGAGLLVPVVGSVLAIGFGARLSRGLAAPAVQWIGDRSYGWYLWHWPLIVFATDVWPHGRPVAGLAAVVALGLAAASYRFVEQPFRHPRPDVAPRRIRRQGLVIGAVCTVVPAVLLGGLYIGATHDWGQDDIRRLAAQVLPLPPGARASGCTGVVDGSVDGCTLHADETGPPIYLLGDSNAGQYANGLSAAGVTLHRPVVVLWRPNCPFVDVRVERDGHDPTDCVAYNAKVLQWLQDHPSGSVVTASVNSYLTASDVTLRDDSGTATSVAAKQAMWTRGLARSLHALAASEHRVLLVGVLPHPGGEDADGAPAWDPQTCSLTTMVRSIADCGRTVALSAEDTRQQPALAAEHDAATAEHVPLLDLRADVCPGGSCAGYRDRRWIYRNGVHISVGESRQLADRLASAVTALG